MGDATAKPMPRGVGGWLLLLIVILVVVGPLFDLKNVGLILAYESLDPALRAVPAWVETMRISLLLLSCHALASVAGGVALAISRRRSAIRWGKMAIWSGPLLGTVGASLQYSAIAKHLGFTYAVDLSIQLGFLFFVSVAVAAAWHAYLDNSVRVKATYIESLPSSGTVPPATAERSVNVSSRATQYVPATAEAKALLGHAITAIEYARRFGIDEQEVGRRIASGRLMAVLDRDVLFVRDPSPPDQAEAQCSVESSTSTDAHQANEPAVSATQALPVGSAQEERLYACIADELDSGNRQKGLWTKCFAEARGDEVQTRVLYIRQRFAQLASDESQFPHS